MAPVEPSRGLYSRFWNKEQQGPRHALFTVGGLAYLRRRRKQKKDREGIPDPYTELEGLVLLWLVNSLVFYVTVKHSMLAPCHIFRVHGFSLWLLFVSVPLEVNILGRVGPFHFPAYLG